MYFSFLEGVISFIFSTYFQDLCSFFFCNRSSFIVSLSVEFNSAYMPLLGDESIVYAKNARDRRQAYDRCFSTDRINAYCPIFQQVLLIQSCVSILSNVSRGSPNNNWLVVYPFTEPPARCVYCWSINIALSRGWMSDCIAYTTVDKFRLIRETQLLQYWKDLTVLERNEHVKYPSIEKRSAYYLSRNIGLHTAYLAKQRIKFTAAFHNSRSLECPPESLPRNNYECILGYVTLESRLVLDDLCLSN